MKQITRSFSGYVCIRICGCSCERFLNLCKNHKISLWKIYSEREDTLAYMRAKDFKKIKKIVRKSHVHIKIEKKYGFAFWVKQHRKRKLFFLGSICCCFFIYFFSLFIWKIDIAGNQELTRETLMDYLNEEHIQYGTKKSEIDCKKIAADLRNEFTMITWVAVEQKGTLLSITIKENDDKIKVNTENQQFTKDEQRYDLISEKDGVITKIITRAGTPMVKQGDRVERGDILVKGEIDITNDEGEIVYSHSVRSDADVYLEYSGKYEDIQSMTYQDVIYTGKRKTGIFVNFLGKWFSTMGKIKYYPIQDYASSEQQLKLFGDYYLPVSVGRIVIREYENVYKNHTKKEAEYFMHRRLEKFILENKEKGVQIFEKNVKIDTSVTICKCTCDYKALALCRKLIWTENKKQIQEGTGE